MPTHVIYPKVSLEMSSGKVSRWLVAEGEAVTSGQILFEIENDKAAVEVEAPAAGVIRHLVAEESEVEVGAPVASIYGAGEAAAEQAAPVAATPAPVAVKPAMVAQATAQGGPRPTPLARRIARDQNVTLSGLIGTGPRGRVQKKDVLAHLQTLAHHPQAPVTAKTLHHVWLRRGTGLPLVLLHGFAGDLNNWRGLFAGARHDGPVLALDLPCHGRSAHRLPADFAALAALVEAGIAALVEGPMVLAGHSFGGAVAAHIAAGGGLDLRGLCLFAPAGLGPEINTGFVDGILRAQEPASLRPWLHELVEDRAVISDAFLTAVADQRKDHALTEAMRAFANRFIPVGTQGYNILADLGRITLPARVVFGRNDRILPFARTADLPGHIALHALPLCGHMPHLEHPALSRRILAEMMAGA